MNDLYAGDLDYVLVQILIKREKIIKKKKCFKKETERQKSPKTMKSYKKKY